MTKQLKVGDAVTVNGGWGNATVAMIDGNKVWCDTESGMRVLVAPQNLKRLHSTVRV